METRETRYCTSSVRSSEMEEGIIEGVVPYGKTSMDNCPGRHCREIILPGAFDRSLHGNRVFLLWQHQMERPIASTANRTLQITSDSVALRFRAEPDLAAPSIADCYRQIRSQLVTDLSFGMQVEEDNWSTDDDGFQLRRIRRAKLFELSCVSAAAYPSAAVSARNLCYNTPSSGLFFGPRDELIHNRGVHKVNEALVDERNLRLCEEWRRKIEDDAHTEALKAQLQEMADEWKEEERVRP